MLLVVSAPAEQGLHFSLWHAVYSDDVYISLSDMRQFL